MSCVCRVYLEDPKSRGSMVYSLLWGNAGFISSTAGSGESSDLIRLSWFCSRAMFLGAEWVTFSLFGAYIFLL